MTLLADADMKVIDGLGVPAKLGLAARQAFLMRVGKLVWRDLSDSTSEQAADVLVALDTLK